MTRRTFTVSGMTCGHCADFVTEELERIAGVTAVTVDLDNDAVTVTSDSDLDVADVRTAIDDAGYELTEAHRE